MITNETGKEQARKLGQYWREHGVEFDHVVASEAVRATDTAKVLLCAPGVPRRHDLFVTKCNCCGRAC
jgi:phosphohistidine phosphatase SixA